MSTAWDHFPNGSSDSKEPREFLVSCEVYISNAAGASLRKPATKTRKLDKRESTGEDLRLKERASSPWISTQKSVSSAGQWRSAACRLMEEGERCLLNVYVDESILYQTVYVHLLNQTDIRHTETSLFYRKDCLGIFCISGQRWTPSNTAEPVYLSFHNSDMCATWQALLKSYAIPEIYGRWFFPLDGGSYRMWRQVELSVIQGRGFGSSKTDAGGNKDDKDDGDGSDVDISCEIHLNELICGRTTVKRGVGSQEWHESFNFPGLPPFENLDVVIWKERKLTKPSVVGAARIALGNFRRGEHVEGWFPVTQPGSLGNELHVGDVRLKIKVDEEIILPYSSYAGLMKTCKSRNFLDWMADLELHLKLKNISSHLMAIAVANNTVIEHIQEYASREVEKSSTSHQTLFRGNTTLTKVIELCMRDWYGKPFLEASIGTVMRRLCAEKVAIEVDPMRSGKSNKDVEKNVEQLIHWVQEFWNQIYSVRAECPNELRMIFKTIRKHVEARYRPDPTDAHNYLPWQSVSAFIFLRFIVPAILHPHLWGITPGMPPIPVQRSLTLIAKVIQSLANLNASSQKEVFMRGVQDLLKDSVPAMIDYIAVVSTPSTEAPSALSGGDDRSRHERINVVNMLHQRSKVMTVLDRESIPILPYLLDIPKHLAIITSAVIRNSRDLSARPRTGDDVDLAIDEFCSRCFQVEEDALSRVSHLATKLASESRRPSIQDLAQEAREDVPTSPRTTITSSVVSANSQSRRRKSSRPSTAPSPTSPESPRRQVFYGENSISSPRTLTRPTQQQQQPQQQRQQQRPWNGHTKAPSTDSVPKIVRELPATPVRLPPPLEPPAEKEDESGKKKGLFRTILRRS